MYGKGPSLSGEDNDNNIKLRFKKNNQFIVFYEIQQSSFKAKVN